MKIENTRYEKAGKEVSKIGNLREQARNIIRIMVTTGDLEPRRIYTTAYLIDLLGISATPIREALFDLVNDGLLESLKNRGFRIPFISVDDLKEIVDLRMMMEIPALRRIAGKLPNDVVVECKALISIQELSIEEGDIIGLLKADHDFHLILIKTYGNYRLANIIEKLRNQTRLVGFKELAKSSQMRGSVQEHALILQALIDGEKGKVDSLMTNHLKHVVGIWSGMNEDETEDKPKNAIV